jgi:hypothetical protein
MGPTHLALPIQTGTDLCYAQPRCLVYEEIMRILWQRVRVHAPPIPGQFRGSVPRTRLREESDLGSGRIVDYSSLLFRGTSTLRQTSNLKSAVRLRRKPGAIHPGPRSQRLADLPSQVKSGCRQQTGSPNNTKNMDVYLETKWSTEGKSRVIVSAGFGISKSHD